MASPSMDKITVSLERSLKSCSLDSTSSNNNNGEGAANGSHLPKNYTALDLNSQVSLPYQSEQCLDIKTGMRSHDDPRKNAAYAGNDSYSEVYSSQFDNDGSYPEPSPPHSPTSGRCINQEKSYYYQENNNIIGNSTNNNVLVVTGCKRCYMYYMVPKNQVICTKCYGQLMHFDWSKMAPPKS